MYKNHSKCRVCNSSDLATVADFGVQPMANDFCSFGSDHSGYAPLKVLFCSNCKLAQLSVIVDPEVLYKNYAYVTSNTKTMSLHFDRVIDEIKNEYGSQINSFLEIGSNDGSFLKKCREFGIDRVLGIEPDKELSESACNEGIPTIRTFWPQVYTLEKYDVIIGRHVFCHVDDWHSFMKKASQLMHDKSILWLETPYVQNMLDRYEADTIYHEHLSYLNLESIERLLLDTDLLLSSVKRYDLHGGCVGLVIKKRNHCKPWIITDENLTVNRWESFYTNVKGLINEVRILVNDLVEHGNKVAGYGASAKSSFWIQQCAFTSKQLSFICDDTPRKQNCVAPGTDIPIVEEEMLLKEIPDYTICFAWNFIDEIIKRQESYIEKGGKFITPIPRIKII